jgi:hypothetical protein
MNGKEYVSSAVEKVGQIASDLKSSDKLEGDPLLEGLTKACETLGSLKNRATLRTKAGASVAIPVFEAAENLEESWEDAEGGDDLDDVKERIEDFIQAVEVFGGALKERTVIMT